MVRVTRSVFRTYMRTEGKNLKDHPTETCKRSVMQYLNEEGRVMAQAVYKNSITPDYFLAKA